MVRKITVRFDTSQREDLEAELFRHLISFKIRNRTGIRHWEAYLAKLLFNKAANLVRDWRKRDAHESYIPGFDNCDIGIVEPRHRVHNSYDEGISDRLALEQAWTALPSRLRQMWGLLLEENGNQVRVAMRLGKHRNTVRLWVREIKAILTQHGFFEDKIGH